ncbi:MAG: aquaporin [Gammaproteobacteria bacterium RIFCSPHIGHO2_12_FULL_45_9]|nr:MAG: aquaporin [Gammaproteobacteria bacterium RIFCSPHIGHO2_12_FULL_45_9]
MSHIWLGEFLGTCFLMLFGSGAVAGAVLKHSKAENGNWLTVSIGWGLAVMLGVFMAQSAGSPGADINPAVSLAKYWMGLYSGSTMLLLWTAQLSGAFLGSTLAYFAYGPHWSATHDPHLKLLVFSTSPAIRHYPSNLLIEIIGTAILVLGIGAIFGPATHAMPVVGLGPYLVGLLIIAIAISLGGPTGYAINPARDLGPRIAHALLPIPGKGPSDWAYAWVPIVGPFIGASLGAWIARLIF